MDAPLRMGPGTLPSLPLESWEATKLTLHLYCQIVGKVRLASHPKLNHWWHVTLYVSPLGLSTGPLLCSRGPFQIVLDVHAHHLCVERWDGRKESFPIATAPAVADVYGRLMDLLRRLDIDVNISAAPYDMPGITTPFAQDHEHRVYDGAAVHRYWEVLSQVDDVLREFRGRFVGKSSPVHLFWHHMDLATARYSGRESAVSGNASNVEREAYSHEVIASGFWAGDAQVREPAFYSYTAPAPPELTRGVLQPQGAHWDAAKGQALLMYEDVRTAQRPREELLRFFESAYRAGADAAGWSVELDAAGSERRRAAKLA